ncbi:hypothetical protein RZS28_18800 (plasmid) [Methylocapsa polymorpha]|uniref:HNH endonuclease n=1 Tax=Methylocapsa polymorpha TaxID=3080828 RepID=A0ABZ0HWY3_9HYPH|nr:hypothetical protein [Methylocapsa sp. RX1]WOJ91779.1 hypothetical protein RZS28_18800 [Methylocapsa sp. RX1]
MPLLPLILSTHASSYCLGSETHKSLDSGSSGSCQFCGLEAENWRERFHLNGDHGDERPTNIAVACVLCHLAQHLERLTIEEEALLIWLPEMTQGALNACMRGVHQTLAAHGEAPHLSRGPKSDHRSVLAAASAYGAFRARAAAAVERLGSTSPAVLGEALLRLSAEDYGRRDKLLAGVRLLPLGRFYRNGEDIYPDLIKQLNEARQTEPGETAGDGVKHGKRR